MADAAEAIATDADVSCSSPQNVGKRNIVSRWWTY